MLKGLDISHWQTGLNLSALTPRPDFVIVKATESVNIVDSQCDKFYQQAKTLGILRGFYHFARPSKNTAVSEADFFVKSCRGYFGDGIPVLDWEDSVKDPAWAKAFLDRVTQLTGVRPLIYMSASVVTGFNWASVAPSYGLWVASYGKNTGDPGVAPTLRHWSNMAAWQYTSKGRWSTYSGNLDLDFFYGDQTAWGLYAKPNQKGKMVEVENSKFEELVNKSTKYDEMVKAGYESVQTINRKLETLQAENDALRAKLELGEVVNADISPSLIVNGIKFQLKDITIDAAGRLNPHYVLA